MGMDLHWILERLHPNGTWHAVYSKQYFFYQSRHGEDSLSTDAYFSSIGRIAHRDYDRFDRLSGLRDTDPNYSLMHPGVPEDASPTTRWIIDQYWGVDGHSHGYALGSEILSWTSPELGTWTKNIATLIDTAPLDHPIEVYNRDTDLLEILGTAHAHAQEILLMRSLYPLSDSNAWRMVIFYDC